MKRIVFAVLIVMMMNSLKSQWLWDFGGGIGASNYLGDIGGKDKTRRDFVYDMKLAKTKYNFGAFARYKFMPDVSLKIAFDYIRIEGDDKLTTNPARHYRNLNFRNSLYTLSFTGEWFFYEDPDLGNTYRYRNSFRSYLFLGASVFYHNPKGFYQGQWINLRPLQTEGVAYSPINFAIPMGLGFYFTFNRKHRIGFEATYWKTFTDYLDDISGNYPSTPPKDNLARAMSLRTPELGTKALQDNPGVYLAHNWGQKRGNPTHKDAFLTMSVSYSYVIRGKSSFYRSKFSWFGKKSKRRVRKIRAKF
ncbi:MAG: hypothetical protein KatS3mg035_2173 [Bacteroidia bacterium]|nr:MAG: hypothetical protein KatS3mg035_2173 [Bacteroidia bacterium]